MTGKSSDGPRSPAWRGQAERLGWLVEAATLRSAGPELETALQCHRRPERRSCGAWLCVRRTDIPAEIQWRCPACGDQGVIKGWRGSAWDLSEHAVGLLGAARAEFLLTAEDHRLLVSQVLDVSARVIIMAAEPAGADVLVPATADGLQHLREWVSRMMGRERSVARARKLRRVIDRIDEASSRIDEASGGFEVEERRPCADARARRAVYELRIELCDIKPRIWRRIRVSGDIDLGRLSEVLQRAMGWSNSHLHEFIAGGVRIGDGEVDDLDDFDDVPHVVEESEVKLGDVLSDVGERLFYVYDFGDDWRHEICVERVICDEKISRSPVCLDGQRACPPEDCGGASGYDHLLDALRDREHPDHIELLHWLGGRFDAEAFSAAEVNRLLS
jgi:hypothetical protein